MKTFKLILKSLISNQAAIDGAKKKPWYFAVIFYLVATVLAVIPTMVTYLTATGSDFLNQSYVYGFDIASTRFIESINDNEIDMIIASEDEDTKYLSVDVNKWNTVYNAGLQAGDIRYVHLVPSQNANDLDVYYTESSGADYNAYVEDVLANYLPGTEIRNNSLDLTRQCSAIIFGKYQYNVYLYRLGNPSPVSSSSGNYNAFEDGFNLRSLIEVYDNGNLVDKDSPGTLYQTYQRGVYNNLKGFFNTGYIEIRNTATWQMTLIMFAINVAIVFFLGIILFIFTRGRNNVYKTLTFWQTQKIVYWCAFSPGILAIILGFILSSMSYIFFPLFISVRSMWVVTKNLRPENTQGSGQPTAKELAAYEAREKARKEREAQKKNQKKSQIVEAEVKEKAEKPKDKKHKNK